MSLTEIVTKDGRTLAIIDETNGTIEETELWKKRRKKRKKKLKEEEEQEDE
jgi:hypothetical protein